MNILAHGGSRDRTPIATLNLILKTADGLGLNLQPVLANTGLSYLSAKRISTSLAPPLLTQFVPIYTALIADVVGISQVSNLPTKEDVDLFCGCLINCEDLNAVISRAIRFNRISNNRWGALAFFCDGQEATWSLDAYRSDDTVATMALDIFCLNFFYRLFSWLIAEPLTIRRVDIHHKRLIDAEIIEDLFCCPVRFDAPQNAIVFKVGALPKPVVRTYRDLIRVLASTPMTLMPLPSTAAFSSHIEMILRKTVERKMVVPNLEEVAILLGQSVSTLRRNLMRESTSFQTIVDDWRVTQATELLGNTSVTTDAIANHLGFSGPSVFSRAFKKWTGLSPSAYRQLLREQSN